MYHKLHKYPMSPRFVVMFAADSSSLHFTWHFQATCNLPSCPTCQNSLSVWDWPVADELTSICHSLPHTNTLEILLALHWAPVTLGSALAGHRDFINALEIWV